MPRHARPRTDPRLRLRPEELEEPAQSILAVLLVASLWLGKFEGGWVTVDQFRQNGLYLRHRRDRESLKTTIRAAVRDLANLREPVGVDSERTHVWAESEAKYLREAHRRLRGGIPLRLWIWFMGDGVRCLEPGIRREFLESQFRPALTLNEVLSGLEDTVVRAYLVRGDFDQAVERARVASSQATDARARRPITLALATALLRRGRPRDVSEAEELLEALYAEKIAPLDHGDLLLEARTRISLGYCKFFTQIRGAEPATASHRRLVARIRTLMGEADALSAELSLSDRGQVANTHGLLSKWEAQVAEDSEEREGHYEQAERYLRQALTLWRLGHDSHGLSVSLYNLGELAFSRYQLHRGHGEEPAIREALSWYEASVAFTEALDTLSEWVLDYIKAAECVALLMPHLVADGRHAECVDRVQRARRYLSKADTVAKPGTWQGKHVRRVHELLEDAVRRSKPPLPEVPDDGR